MVRPWPGVVLLLQPRRGGALLRAGRRARPGLLGRALGRRLREGPQLQQALEDLRPRRPRRHPRLRPRRAGPGARDRLLGTGARARRSAPRTLPHRRAPAGPGGLPRLRPGLRGGHAPGPRGAPARPGRGSAVRRRPAVRQPACPVGPGHGRADRLRHAGGRAGPAGGTRPARGRAAPGPEPPVHPPDGHVGAPGARRPRRRQAAPSGPGRLAHGAHGHPHRRRLRRLPPRRRIQPGRGGRGRRLLRAGEDRRPVLRLPRPQPVLPGLRRDDVRSFTGSAARRTPARRTPHARGAAGREPPRWRICARASAPCCRTS